MFAWNFLLSCFPFREILLAYLDDSNFKIGLRFTCKSWSEFSYVIARWTSRGMRSVANVTNKYGKCVSFVDAERGGWIPIIRRLRCWSFIVSRHRPVTQSTKESCKQNETVSTFWHFARENRETRKRVDKWPSHVFTYRQRERTFKRRRSEISLRETSRIALLDDLIVPFKREQRMSFNFMLPCFGFFFQQRSNKYVTAVYVYLYSKH